MFRDVDGWYCAVDEFDLEKQVGVMLNQEGGVVGRSRLVFEASRPRASSSWQLISWAAERGTWDAKCMLGGPQES